MSRFIRYAVFSLAVCSFAVSPMFGQEEPKKGAQQKAKRKAREEMAPKPMPAPAPSSKTEGGRMIITGDSARLIRDALRDGAVESGAARGVLLLPSQEGGIGGDEKELRVRWHTSEADGEGFDATAFPVGIRVSAGDSACCPPAVTHSVGCAPCPAPVVTPPVACLPACRPACGGGSAQCGHGYRSRFATPHVGSSYLIEASFAHDVHVRRHAVHRRLSELVSAGPAAGPRVRTDVQLAR